MKGFIKNFFFLTVPSILFILLILELVFRFVIPAQKGPDYYFDSAYGIVHFDTSTNTSGLYTVGKFAQEKGQWSVNNFGWNSPYNYEAPRSKKKRIAVIGDSFVEGLNVNNTDVYPFRLQKMLGDSVEVYAFGISGAPLSEYLSMSRYVRATFNPDIFIINVVHNDFDESLKENQTLPFYQTLDVSSPEHIVEIPPIPYKLSPYKRWIKKSALFRYFYLNLQLNFDKPPQLQDADSSANKESFNANINVAASQKQRSKIELATNYIFRKLREENAGKEILVVMDGPRNNIYAGTTEKSNVLFLNDIAAKYAPQHQLNFIDLTSVFQADYQKNKKKFNSDLDFHWNQYGHSIVADTVFNFLKKETLVSPAK